MSLPLKEQFKMMRDAIKHEDTLTNYRTTWMLVFHGFLFSAYATAGGLGNPAASGAPAALCHGSVGLSILSVLGVLSAIATAIGTSAADKQLRATRDWWLRQCTREKLRREQLLDIDDSQGEGEPFPPQYKHSEIPKLYSQPAIFILLAIAWVVLGALIWFRNSAAGQL
jgi:hypothetical protein